MKLRILDEAKLNTPVDAPVGGESVADQRQCPNNG
jgi:hypothetical protein